MNKALLTIAIIISILLGLADGTFQVFIAGITILIIGLLLTLLDKAEYRVYKRKVFLIVFCVYFVSAYIVSLCFDSSRFYGMTDPMREIDLINSNSSFDLTSVLGYLYLCYFELADNNGLYLVYLNLLGSLGRGANGYIHPAYLTALISAFGILSSLFLFNLISKYTDDVKKVAKYTLIFCLCSAFLFYSTVIIRDIIICFFYLIGFNIILSRFSIAKLAVLVFLMIVIVGFRLYSGLFFALFIFFYIYRNIRLSKWKSILITIALTVVVVVISPYGFIIDQSLEEMQSLKDYSEDRQTSGSLTNIFQTLPPGVKHIALVLFSQIIPFPPYVFLYDAETLPQLYYGVLNMIYSVWWFVIFYSLLFFLFIHRSLSKIDFDFRFFLLACVLFILLNSAQFDIRRIMPLYPLLYILFVKPLAFETIKTRRVIQARVVVLYVIMILIYTIIKI